jgi:hypothetical protein
MTTSTSHRAQRRRSVTINCLNVLLSLAAITACSSGPREEPDGSAGSQSPILAEYDVSGLGWAMASTPQHLWVQVDPPVDAVVRVDKALRCSLLSSRCHSQLS